ncbi:hypothetical protein CLAFUW4_05770 [Fulvia fulva]|uniref:Uncharacterized protein n=1 Tax=Passalora fulva TaxID=5499 RepID=A0A9Q8LIG5_PASFU|nr:uncharacterized protein CLAFUR5_05912 [Fulvia fulva]KAK4624309.1 hypothetical protein CLAFUR4_05764 [Fulvia fulva]KAK4625012.1 hypothetical protein CLAFUR0_05775 [Fulvia fulva]UJO17988.1 hypothetical protein CLAFUR5_05912 [Fulvia fulva]WPV14524.1 hypothetical protein CLAFUW4_05770 [Fulvia fulva]WPV29472.1 hypothetical protein CLAFUW7_05768 [Fulvia fulva]
MSIEQAQKASPKPPSPKWYEEDVAGFGVIFNPTIPGLNDRTDSPSTPRNAVPDEVQYLGAWLNMFDSEHNSLCVQSELPGWLSFANEVMLEDCTQRAHELQWQSASLNSTFAGTPQSTEHDQYQYEERMSTTCGLILPEACDSGSWISSDQSPQSADSSARDSDLAQLGWQNGDLAWSCGYPGCRSEQERPGKARGKA